MLGMHRGPAFERLRKWYKATPIHRRRIPAYGIAQNETTFEQYMVFLRQLSPSERETRIPDVDDPFTGISSRLQQKDDGGFVFHWRHGDTHISADETERFVYPNRLEHRRQVWQRFPVFGISGQDARAYASWLSTRGGIPGERLCTEDEWERAARGADGREFLMGVRSRPTMRISTEPMDGMTATTGRMKWDSTRRR